MKIAEIVANALKYLDLIAPVFITYLVVVIAAAVIRGYNGFVESIKVIISNKKSVLFFLVLIIVFYWLYYELKESIPWI